MYHKDVFREKPFNYNMEIFLPRDNIFSDREEWDIIYFHTTLIVNLFHYNKVYIIL